MTHPFYCLCPNCFAEDSLKGNQCIVCHARAQHSTKGILWGEARFTTEGYARWLEENLPLQPAGGAKDDPPQEPQLLRRSGPAHLYQFDRTFFFRGYRNWFRRWLEKPRRRDRGRLFLYRDRAVFRGDSGRIWVWPSNSFTCVTTDGPYFQFKVENEPAFQIHFRQESALKYELLFRRWLQEAYSSTERAIVEFQPHLRFHFPQPASLLPLANPGQETPLPRWERALLAFLALAVRWLLRPWVSVRVEKKACWPREWAGFVIANHQSALDPFLIGAYWNAHIAFLTKSSSFASWLPRTFLRWTKAIPTTRFQTDPTVVNQVRSVLRRGIRVGIFPEGERCWDGQLRPFKLGTIRMLQAYQLPVFPVVVKNSFHFWPRWRHLPSRARVTLQLHPPFCLMPGVPVEELQQFLMHFYQQNLSNAQSHV